MKTFASIEKRSASAGRKAYPYVHHPMGPVQRAQQTEIHRILRSTGAQTKLTIGQPNDNNEQEADRVADQVMRMPEPKLQRKPEAEEEEETLQTKPLNDQISPYLQRQGKPPDEDEGLIQAKTSLGHTPQVASNVATDIQSLVGGGQPLTETIRSFFEPRFGHNFSQVRIHTDAKAADTATAVNARAFTLGRDVVFGTGEFSTDSSSGRRLLAHELTHVVQQASAHPNKNPRPVESKYRPAHIQRKSILEDSFIGKSFIVQDKKAVLRNGDLSPKLYKNGDEIPEGKKIGDKKIIPKGAEAYVLRTKIDSKRNTYAYVVQKGSTFWGMIPTYEPLGWAAVTNFKDKFENIVTGTASAKYDLASVFGFNQTVWDPNALLRDGDPNYKSTGAKIGQGTYVVVMDKSDDTEPEGKYVKIAGAGPGGKGFLPGHIIGWTSASNLKEGWADIFGPNAAWERGKYLGQMDLVNTVGTKGETEQITSMSYPRYRDMISESGKAGVQIVLNSGFRSYPMQAYLYNGYKSGKSGFNLAAKPGRSNHQNGKAFDLNTTGSGGAGWGAVYNWLKSNGWGYGFIRTVRSEHWHWEYRPDKVKKGKHTTWGI